MKQSLTLPNIAVPVSLVKEPDHFGGQLIGECLVGDLVIQGARAVGLRASDLAPQARLLTPKFAESHVHLDKCFTFDRIGNLGGDLVAAIEAQAKDRASWTRKDLAFRAGRALDDLSRFGCHVVRSHVDWTHGSEADQPPLAWHVLNELAQVRKEDLTLQIAALTGIEDLADPAMADAIGRLCATKNGVLGAFVFGRAGSHANRNRTSDDALFSDHYSCQPDRLSLCRQTGPQYLVCLARYSWFRGHSGRHVPKLQRFGGHHHGGRTWTDSRLS